MLKKIIASCILLLSGCVTAQEKPKATKLAESIVGYYNDAQYKDIHNLLSADFKKEFPQEQLVAFFRDNVAPAYGKIMAVKFLHSADAENYVLTCEQGKLKMALYLNALYEIAGMQWLPYKEESTSRKKKASYPSDNALKTAFDLKVDSVVKDYMLSEASCGMSVAVYRNGQYHYYNFGETTRDHKTLPTRNSVYEIGSITKTFTGVLLAQAVEEGKIKLHDDIRDYLPGKYLNLQFKGQPIRIEHLANHTSRIPTVPDNLDKQANYDPLNPYKNYNRNMIFDFLKTVELDTTPGVKNEYSNTGMALLGLILEKVCNKSYSELVATYITKPNGLVSTTVNVQSGELKNKVTGYNEEGTLTPYWDLNDFAAAGGVNSTSKELLDYFVWNMNEPTEALKFAHRTTWESKHNGVALGWHIIKTRKGYRLLWHNGGTYGFSSFGGYIKEKNCAVVVLSNSGSKVDVIGMDILKYLQR